PLDYEKTSNVMLEVSGQNQANLSGTTAQWMSIPVDVTVIDIDEGPEFFPPTVRYKVKENIPNGTVIGTYKAVDPETKSSNGIMYYKISDPGSWVGVNKNTGELTVTNTIDRESPLVQDGIYNITVRAVDATSKSGIGTVILEIEEENDNKPSIPAELRMCEQTDDRLGSLVVVAKDNDLSPFSAPFTFSMPPVHDGNWDDSNIMFLPKPGFEQAVKGSVKGSMVNAGWLGNKSTSTIGGYGVHDNGFQQNSGLNTMNKHTFSSSQFGQYGQHVESQVFGNSMDRAYFGQESTQLSPHTVITHYLSLPTTLLVQKLEYLGTEGNERFANDIIHSYGYEGLGSVAGSVGCCSENDDEGNLEFLDTLGPKFKTLAEITTKR
ncbi:hypothetical protein GOODEAATRI_005380, partial [Goodea atripinnis]